MRVGQKRRDLRDIFNANARSGYSQNASATKAFRSELKKKVDKVEEYLGTTGEAIEGSTREDLMLLIDDILQQLAEQENEIANLHGQMEQMIEDTKRLEKYVALQQELIHLYEKIDGSHDSASKLLMEKIEELTTELEKLRKPSASKPKEMSAQEQEEALKKKIERSEKRRAKLMEQLKALQEVQEAAPETIESEADGSEKADVLPENKQEPETEGTDQETGDDVAESKDAELSVDGNGEGKPVNPDEPIPDAAVEHGQSYEELKKALEQEHKQVEDLKEELEDLNYKANRDHTTSSAPPRTKTYANAGKYDRNTSETQPATEESGTVVESPTEESTKPNDSETEQDKEDIAAAEEAAEEAALHDPHKSPNEKPASGRRGKPVCSPGGGRTIPVADKIEEVKCFHSRCRSCPHRETCEGIRNAQKYDRPRIIYDIQLVRVRTDYQPMKCACPLNDGEELIGDYPDDARNWFRFGNGIRSLAVVLNTVGMVSCERIADILKGLLNDDKLSAQSVNKWVAEAAGKLRPVVKYIKAGVFKEDYLHCDETGVHVKGALHWVHTACNMMFTYMRVDRQRGNGAMNRIGVLPGYMGTLITDCWASYWEKGSRHGLCNAHLLRELLALVKYFARDKEWAQEMMDLLYEMNKRREELKEEGKDRFEEEELQDFYRRYDAIIEKGLKIHPDDEGKKNGRGRVKHYRGRNLLDRLKEHKDNFLLFLVDFDCPFSNNIAEKSFRLVAIKRSVVGSFETYEGADDFAIIWSYIDTAHKRKLNRYEAIKAAFDGEAKDYLFEEAEIMELDDVLKDLEQKNLEHFQTEIKARKAELEEAKKKAAEKKEKAQQSSEKAESATIEAEAAKADAAEARRLADELGSSGGMNADTEEKSAAKAEEMALKKQANAEKARAAASAHKARAEKEAEKVRKFEKQIAWETRAWAYFLEIPEEEWQAVI